MVTKNFRGKYLTKSEHARQYNLAMVGWGGGEEGGVGEAVPNACITAVYTSPAATYELFFRLDVTVSSLAQVQEQ
jgi:hypothetical protein